jgi:hypothetical protein
MNEDSPTTSSETPESPEGFSKELETSVRYMLDSGALDGLLREALVRMLEELDALRGLVDEIYSITIHKTEARIKIRCLVEDFWKRKNS